VLEKTSIDVSATIHDYHELGVQFAPDYFGTGYSSLTSQTFAGGPD
jgi:EAL domain-containing protein (putative c-di-GMP-specific phosphodiesterase class I)